MEKNPPISNSEWEVMEAVWVKHPATAPEIMSRLAGQQEWKEQTIRTMLTRLVKKNVLSCRTNSKPQSYIPLLHRDQVVRTLSRGFFAKILKKASAPVLVELIRSTELSPDDIESLRQILLEKQKGKKS